jgi:hypothetical protein
MQMVGAVGIEPTTFGLKGRCSTTELRPYGRLSILPEKRKTHMGAETRLENHFYYWTA